MKSNEGITPGGTPTGDEKEEIYEQNKIDKILGGYTDLTPTQFVNTLERLYHTIVNKSINDSLHILSSYKDNHIVNYHLIDFKSKTQNTSKLVKKINEINCVKVTQDLLFTGENDGLVYMYKIDKGVESEKRIIINSIHI